MALNVYGKESWATKITSMLEDTYTQYDASDYDTAPGANKWIIAESAGNTRDTIANGNLSGVTFDTCFHGLDDLTGVTHGVGLVVGEGSLIRATATIGDHVYIGANCTIDIGVTIGNYVTIGDNVVISEGHVINDYESIPSGTVYNKDLVS
jgi:carbonic anhydrase/acetyltransferase-like protein (isoleucine patch superfamily)